MRSVLEKISSLKTLDDISKVLTGEGVQLLPVGNTANEAGSLKFCPIASADVERSFSIFKNVFSDCHQPFTEENLAKTIILNCYNSRKIEVFYFMSLAHNFQLYLLPKKSRK